MTKGLKEGRGEAMNRVKIGGTTELFGDPSIKIEKPHTAILFPGGNVEIARCSDGQYWVHVSINNAKPGQNAKITRCRLDADGRYCDDVNEAMNDEINRGSVNHIAFLVKPSA